MQKKEQTSIGSEHGEMQQQPNSLSTSYWDCPNTGEKVAIQPIDP